MGAPCVALRRTRARYPAPAVLQSETKRRARGVGAPATTSRRADRAALSTRQGSVMRHCAASVVRSGRSQRRVSPRFVQRLRAQLTQIVRHDHSRTLQRPFRSIRGQWTRRQRSEHRRAAHRAAATPRQRAAEAVRITWPRCDAHQALRTTSMTLFSQPGASESMPLLNHLCRHAPLHPPCTLHA